VTLLTWNPSSNSLFEFQVIHGYIFIVVEFCLNKCNLDLQMVCIRNDVIFQCFDVTVANSTTKIFYSLF